MTTVRADSRTPPLGVTPTACAGRTSASLRARPFSTHFAQVCERLRQLDTHLVGPSSEWSATAARAVKARRDVRSRRAPHLGVERSAPRVARAAVEPAFGELLERSITGALQWKTTERLGHRG